MAMATPPRAAQYIAGQEPVFSGRPKQGPGATVEQRPSVPGDGTGSSTCCDPPGGVLVIFKYIPMANNVIAFKDYNVVTGHLGQPLGRVRELRAVLRQPVFWDLISNTFSWPLPLPGGLPDPDPPGPGAQRGAPGFFKRTVQLVTYAPYFISTVIVVSMTILIFSPRIGHVETSSGCSAWPRSPGDPDYFRHIYVWSDVWQTAGYSAVIYMAALPASTLRCTRPPRSTAPTACRSTAIDLPGIADRRVILMLGVGNIMAIGFEKAYLLQNPLNLAQAEIIATYVYKTGLLNADFSLATAIGLFNSVVNLFLLLFVNIVAKRVTGNGLWWMSTLTLRRLRSRGSRRAAKRSRAGSATGLHWSSRPPPEIFCSSSSAADQHPGRLLLDSRAVAPGGSLLAGRLLAPGYQEALNNPHPHRARQLADLRRGRHPGQPRPAPSDRLSALAHDLLGRPC